MSAKKTFFTVLVVLFITPFIAFGQVKAHDIFGKGDNSIGLGIGLDGHYSYNGNNSGYNQTVSFTLSYENCAIDPVGKSGAIGFGAYLTYFTSNLAWSDYGYKYSDKYVFEFLTARAAYHYHVRFSAKIDPYAGLSIGYVITQHNFTTNDPATGQNSVAYQATHFNEPSPLAYGGFLGARYFIANQFGLFGELVIFNQGYNYIGFGLTWKF